ncbi:PHP domain protein [bacterium BMS3Abin01]|nr:PHP domain protein [bacterium BMS3Abin01]HDZ59755.1 hypothetical protein [Actinomycetota bacterium]
MKKRARLDIHVHTSPGSGCSSLGVESYLRAMEMLGVSTVCVTNHGDMADYRRLVRLAPAGTTVTPGVEISSPEGDFLLFSADIAFLETLSPVQDLPARRDRPAGTAVVWAHPFAGIRGGLAVTDSHVQGVAGRVDGIEVFNGNWPDAQASGRAEEIAAHYGLARLGGSDSHRRRQLFRCWTEVEEGTLAEAILRRKTSARRGQQ